MASFPTQLLAAGLWLLLLVSQAAVVLGVGGWWLWLGLKRRVRLSPRSLRNGLLLIAANTMALALCGLLLDRVDPFNQARFDRHAWQTPCATAQRGPMTRNLERRHLRKGMRRDAVLALLGKPDKRESYQGRPLVEGRDYERAREIIRYDLGPWSGFAMDWDHLDLAFDEAGRLLGWWVWQS